VRETRDVLPNHVLRVRGASLHNLRNIDVDIPLHVLCCVTGVSGSGKSSLVTQTLVPAVRRLLANEALSDLRATINWVPGVRLDRIVEIDQSPIGKTGRSNPATYSGLWDHIRRLLARTRESRLRGYTARRFSFNARDGRCAECRGQGTRRIEMQFLPDMHVTCPVCRGARFNRQTLAVRFRGKNAADMLQLRIDEARDFFHNISAVRRLLTTFCEVGLGYLCLGQSSLTLSGGEAQRVKLATELHHADERHTLFVLDEPTTGLHPADVQRLLDLLDRLVHRGNSVLVVEHHLDVMAAADWIIDLGPDGGAGGGSVVALGTPRQIAQSPSTPTTAALAAFFTGE
jgi:excinuclease ABC subunit A